MSKTDLSQYNNNWYKTGASIFKRTAWLIVQSIFFAHSLAVISSIKVFILRMFGAKMGKGIVIKPNVSIKYPWKLSVGDFTWIGEGVWIDNLAEVTIGKNVCISQRAYLLTGNHNFKKSTFDLMVKPIILEDGVWIGAKAIVCPGIVCYSHSILTVASVATVNLEPYYIYQGNPAQKIKERVFE